MSNGRVMVVDEWEWMWKEAVVSRIEAVSVNHEIRPSG
jgi:hypothetical protein